MSTLKKISQVTDSLGKWQIVETIPGGDILVMKWTGQKWLEEFSGFHSDFDAQDFLGDRDRQARAARALARIIKHLKWGPMETDGHTVAMEMAMEVGLEDEIGPMVIPWCHRRRSDFMGNVLTATELDWLAAGFCPDCGKRDFREGPRELSRYRLCVSCGSEFHKAPGNKAAHRASDKFKCPPERRREIYCLEPVERKVA